MHTQSRTWTTHTRFFPVILVALIGLNACQTTPAKPGRKPFGGTPSAVAGVIQAEDFDEGGPGVSFYRGKVSTTSDPASRNADVRNNSDGTAELVNLEKDDWFEYTINVTSGGQHDLITRLKSPFSSGYFLKLDGKELGERIPTPYQGPGDWIEVRTNGLEIPEGTHVLRITFDGTISSFDQFEFKRITQPIIESVAISLTSPISASVNKDLVLGTVLTGQGAFDRGLTWTVAPGPSSNLTPNGEKATFRTSTAGSFNITATSTSNPSKKSTVTVNASVIQAQSPADVGRWEPKFDWPTVSIHAVVLPNGKIMSWNSSDKGDGYVNGIDGQPKVTETVTWLWDPETDPNSTKQTSVLNTHTNMFCAGHSLLPDGKLLVVGGHIFNLRGFPHTNTYDFKTSQWTAGPNTNKGRWYPTTLVLGSGDVLIANGYTEETDPNKDGGVDNRIPQIWQSASSTLRTLTTGDIGEDRAYYPMLYQLKNGLVFNAGPQNEMSTLDVSGTGQWTRLNRRDDEFRSYGSSVMFKPGQILVTGGSGNSPPTSSNTIINTDTISTGNPTPTIAPAMAVARRQHNATMLPNGEVIITGGTSGTGFNDNKNPVMFAESWDSNKPNQAFKKLPSMTVPRLYHSIALLMPDGRILSSGGAGACDSSDPIYGPCTHKDAEIYTPAYLFNPNGTLATRPVIASAPTEITYGSAFSFSTDTDIAKASLVKLSSVTHSQNFDQRIHDLTSSLQKSGLSYTATAPTDRNTYAPGYYMLFGLNAAGVPSKAKILQLK